MQETFGGNWNFLGHCFSFALPLREEKLYNIVWKENDWMKYRDIPDFTESSKLEGEMSGAAFLGFLRKLRVFMEKKRLDKNHCLFLNGTSNFDGLRMHKYSTVNGEVYIWYTKLVQLQEVSTKENNIQILAVLEKKKETAFSDDLLIPLYSQMFNLATKGAKRKVFGGEKHLFIFFTLFATDMPINTFLLGIEAHSSSYPCGCCTVKAFSGLVFLSPFCNSFTHTFQ